MEGRHKKNGGRLETSPARVRTCENCAKGKIKCRKDQDAKRCHRCIRLGKECVFRPARRSFNATALRSRDSGTRISEVNSNQLLNVTGPSDGDSISPVSSLGQVQEMLPFRDSAHSDPMSSELRSVPATLSVRSRSTSYTTSSSLLDMDNAQRLLNLYRTTMMSHFPFVIISPDMTAERLRRQNDFLFLAIMAAASNQQPVLQKALLSEIKHAISDRMLLGGELSFSMLQGLLVYLAFSQYHPPPKQYTQVLYLAVGIVVDFRLDRPRSKTSWKTAVLFDGDNTGTVTNKQASPDLDAQRAVVGCYYLSSTIALLLQKSPALPYSSYILDYCQSLQSACKYPTDAHLLDIVRLQRIIEKFSDLMGDSLDTIVPDVLLEAHVVVTKSELDAFKRDSPFSMVGSNLLWLQSHSIELYLYQISLIDRNASQARSLAWRLDMLNAGLISSRSLFQYYLSLPSRAELAWNNTEWIQLAFAGIVACKLCLAASAESIHEQTRNLRDLLDMPGVLQQCIARFDSLIDSLTEMPEGKDTFGGFRKRTLNLQSWFGKHYTLGSRLTAASIQAPPHSNDAMSFADQSTTAATVQLPASGDLSLGLDPLLVGMQDFQSLDIPIFGHEYYLSDWMNYEYTPF